jgi:hypothetical protein
MAREEVLAALPEWAQWEEEGVSHLAEDRRIVDFAGSYLVSELLQTEEQVKKIPNMHILT